MRKTTISSLFLAILVWMIFPGISSAALSAEPARGGETESWIAFLSSDFNLSPNVVKNTADYVGNLQEAATAYFIADRSGTSIDTVKALRVDRKLSWRSIAAQLHVHQSALIIP